MISFLRRNGPCFTKPELYVGLAMDSKPNGRFQGEVDPRKISLSRPAAHDGDGGKPESRCEAVEGASAPSCGVGEVPAVEELRALVEKAQ